MKSNWDSSLSSKFDEISRLILSVLISSAFFLRDWILREISLAKPSVSNSGVSFVSSSTVTASFVLKFLISISLMFNSLLIISSSSSVTFIGALMEAFARGHFIPMCALSRSLSAVDTMSLAVCICCSSSSLINFAFGFG